MTALLRYHYAVDTEVMDDESIIKLWQEYVFCKGRDRELQLGVMRQVIGEAFGKQN